MMKRYWLILILTLLIFSLTLSVSSQVTSDAPETNIKEYNQILKGKDSTLGNLMYARLLDSHLGTATSDLLQHNTLSFIDNLHYRLIKSFSNTSFPRFSLTYEFEGSYIESDKGYTLKTPISTSARIDWGDLDKVFPGQSGHFTQLDSIAYPRTFNTPFLGDDNGDADMYVKIDANADSFQIVGNQNENERIRIFDSPTSRDGLKIYGNFTLPADANSAPWPLVVFAHGFAGHNAIQRDIAVVLAQQGIASYRFDFIGGTPFGSRSDGNFYEMSMLTEKQDLLTVMDYVITQDFVDRNNVYLFGESMGGAVAAMVAAEVPELIRGQIHFYPAFSISEQTRAVYKSEADIPERAGTSAGIMVAKKFYADALTIEIFKEIAPYNGPVQIFHGALDTVVPLIYAYKAVETLKNTELIVYDSEGHGFSRQTKYQAISNMLRFIKQTQAK